MTTSPTALWPTEPSTTADGNARLAWYAAVARWAPSKHNTQPWRFVVTADALEIWADSSRSLAATDPFRRELTVSCGAALHLACVAARALGVQPIVSVLPDGQAGCLARVVEGPAWSTTTDDRALLAAIAERRTDRGPLDGDAVAAELPFLLQSAAAAEGATLRLVRGAGDRATLAHLISTADRLLRQRGVADAELARWLREPGDRRDDGVPTSHTRGHAASFRAEFVQREFSSSRSMAAQNRPDPDRALVGVLCTPSDRPEQWIAAGRALAAVLLRAAMSGANASYLNQPVEEPRIRAMLRDDLALDGVPQLVLRMGVGAHVPPTPRRPVDGVTLNTAGHLA
jgi:nitroreductase